jgi:ABC-type Na+ efflux pump permease subunit
MKDWQLHRAHISLSMVAGVIALAILRSGNDTAFMIGAVWYFVVLFVLASMLPISNVINERKKQTVVFLMSLPLSALQYGMAKMVSTVGIFLISWVAMVAAGTALVLSRHDIPKGIVPLMLALFILPLIGFCMTAGAALISESEGWTIAVTIAGNSSYWLVWYFIMRIPAITGTLKSPVPVWNGPIMNILGVEAAAILLILGLTCYLQSRKREFV